MTTEQLYNEAIQGAYCLLVLIAAAIVITLIVVFFVFVEYWLTHEDTGNIDESRNATGETGYTEYDITPYADEDEDNPIFNR